MNTSSSLIAFQTMVDLVETVLAKSELAIAKHYEAMLVKEEDMPKELGAEAHSIHLAILDLTEHEQLNENKLLLMRLLFVRNAYVDCLSNIYPAVDTSRISVKSIGLKTEREKSKKDQGRISMRTIMETRVLLSFSGCPRHARERSLAKV
jgi:phosphoenolpyruvate carboxylase